MLGAGRHDQDIGGPHVERPVGHAIRGIQQHPDHELVVGRDALRPNSSRKRTDAEGKISDADMTQGAAKFPASELHHFDVGSLDRLVKALETLQAAGIYRDMRSHRPPPKATAPVSRYNLATTLARSQRVYRTGLRVRCVP
jgi:hypothetical protein